MRVPEGMPEENNSMTTNLRGILAPALTAVTDDFQIHEERTLAHFRWLLENGCDGLVVFGTTSEANSFSVIERRRLLERAVSVGINAKKLIVGTGCCSLADSIELMKHAVQVGCAGALTLPPFYYKGVSDALLKYPPIPALKAIISKTRDDTAWKTARPPLLPLTESEFVGLTTELTAAGFEWPKTTASLPIP